MQLILAIDSDPRRSEQLAGLVHARLTVDLVQATSAGEALHALKDRVPDLILTSPLLSPFDDGVLDEYLRDLGAAAAHVQTLRIPMLSNGPRKKSAAKRLFSLGRKATKTSPASPDGCDPKVFADEIAHYLTRSLEERTASAKATADRAAAERSFEPAAQPVTRSMDEWEAADTLLEDIIEPAPSPTATVFDEQPDNAERTTGSIFDLRSDLIRQKPSTPGLDAEITSHVEAEPLYIDPDPPMRDERLRQPLFEREPVTFVRPEPEPTHFPAPEPFSTVEPELVSIVEPEPVVVEPEPLAFDQAVPITVIEPEPIEPVLIEPLFTPAPERPPVATQAAVRVSTSKETPTAPPVTAGNSASFEAALAAIRAAWAKPDTKDAAPAPMASTTPAARPLAGSGEVDLTTALDDTRNPNGAVDAEDDDAEGPRGSNLRKKVDKTKKRQDKLRGRKAHGPDEGQNWGAFDPNTCDFSALVNKLDEVTDADEVVITRTTDRR